MLDGLRNWTMMIAGVVVFGSLCDVILPDGSFRKYIRLAIGLMLVFALVSPFTNLLNVDFYQAEDDINRGRAYLQREEMEEKQEVEVMRIYKYNLSQQIKRKIEDETGAVCSVVDCAVEENRENFGRIKRVDVLLEEVNGSDITERAKAVVTKDFGVQPEYVYIQRSKGDNG